MSKQDRNFEFGVKIAASVLGVDHRDVIQDRAREEVFQSEEGYPYQRELCKIASAAFRSCGDMTSAPSILFYNLANAEEWSPGYSRFSDSVRRALGKQANILPAAAVLHDKMGGGVLKTLTAGGALGGAALGSLAFILSRNARQSSAENEALLEKVRAYKKLKRDIEEDMADNKVMSLEGEVH